MTPDQDAELCHLLECWHRWQEHDRGVRGFNSKALMIGDTRAMKVQYEAQLERQDEEHDRGRCKTIDAQVREMTDPHRTAIYFLAKNLHVGNEVNFSPRLPSIRADRLQVEAEAKSILAARLRKAGVLDWVFTVKQSTRVA